MRQPWARACCRNLDLLTTPVRCAAGRAPGNPWRCRCPGLAAGPSLFPPRAFAPPQNSSQCLWITNPHNPSGQLWDRQSLEALLPSYALVVCDEAFLPLVPGGEAQSLVPLLNRYPNLVVIRSLTTVSYTHLTLPTICSV